MLQDAMRPDAQPVTSARGLFVFMPRLGNGMFGQQSLAHIERSRKKLHIRVERTLTHEEQCRLCDAHEHFMFYWMLLNIPKGQGDSGALCMCIPYSEGVTGNRVPHPHAHATHNGGNSV